MRLPPLQESRMSGAELERRRQQLSRARSMRIEIEREAQYRLTNCDHYIALLEDRLVELAGAGEL